MTNQPNLHILSATWLMITKQMKKISILGSGWLGLPLAESLVNQGYEVKASTRSPERFDAIKDCHASPFIVDIDHIDGSIDDFLRADILIVNITSKDIEAFKILIGRIEPSSIQNVIFVSSTSVYNNTMRTVTEDGGDENPHSPLYQIENLFRANKHFTTTIVRFAGLVGYSRHPGRFFGERRIPQPDAPVNMIHRDDCLNILAGIIQRKLWGQVFNACSDTHPSKREFYSHARQRIGLAQPEFEQTANTEYKIIDNSKIKQALGYQFVHADLLKSGL